MQSHGPLYINMQTLTPSPAVRRLSEADAGGEQLPRPGHEPGPRAAVAVTTLKQGS